MSEVAAPQKLARYRSQKRVDPPAQDEPASSEPPLPVDDGVTRSKSRYRRRAPTTSGSSPPNTAQPDLPRLLQNDVPSRYRSPSKPLHQTHIVQSEQLPTGPIETSEEPHARQTSPRTAPRAAQTYNIEQGSHPNAVASTEPVQLRARQSVKRQALPESKPRPPTPPPLLPETVPDGQLFPPPKPEVKLEAKPVRMDGPPRSNTIRATKSMSELRKAEDDSSDGGCFTLFRRKKAELPPVPDRKMSEARPKTAAKAEQPFIKPGGGGIVPGTDAPVSAVNAGDRRVLLECGQSKTFFPVTPTTTPVDLLKSASLCMSEYIDVKSAVLLESFSTAGVQRPLRRYEHLRDVMNSWDSDGQNSLTLIDPGIGSMDNELTITGVPAEKPEDASWVLLYSQKPGKWEKRVVSLKSDGQITCRKDSEKSKDLVNLCHLSDFDIYTPAHERARKKVRPPKKLCYAIKSQQKSSMFESTQNFVHFFCTGDKTTADNFYTAVQGWRSWYLVNVLGEGRKAAASAPANTLFSATSSSTPANGHRVKESVDSHYQLGSFQPLLDLSELEAPPEVAVQPAVSTTAHAPIVAQAIQSNPHSSPERRTSIRRHPPVALNNKAVLAEDEPLVNFNRKPSVEKHRSSVDQKTSDTDEFKASGLLGRSYSQRQKDYAEKEIGRSQPFTDGPSLLNGGFDESNRLRDTTRRQAANNSDLHTTKSTRDRHRNAGHVREGSGGLHQSPSQTREMPKPLLDLTPEHREPVQHARKGRGFQVENPGSNGLIANATSPDDQQPSSVGASDPTRLAHARSHSLSRSNTQSRSRGGSTLPLQTAPQPPPLPTVAAGVATAAAPDQAFTGEGLLAGSQAQRGWGGGTKGRGVMDGSAANGRPMLDLGEQSQFVQNSLLHRVERDYGPSGPIIDREKRDERDMKYGEGF